MDHLLLSARLACTVKVLALIDVFFLLWSILNLAFFAAILLPLPVMGFIGASRFRPKLLIGYVLYLIIRIGLNIAAVKTGVAPPGTIDFYSVVIASIISAFCAVIVIGLFQKLRKLQAASLNQLQTGMV